MLGFGRVECPTTLHSLSFMPSDKSTFRPEPLSIMLPTALQFYSYDTIVFAGCSAAG